MLSATEQCQQKRNNQQDKITKQWRQEDLGKVYQQQKQAISNKKMTLLPYLAINV